MKGRLAATCSGSAARFSRPLSTLQNRIGSQPQRDVRRLHGLPDHTFQIIAQGVQVGLLPELGRESLKGLSRVVLPAVEAPVYEALDAMSQGVEQSGYCQRRSHDPKLGCLTCERPEEFLKEHHATQVHRYQHRCERAVYEGT